MERAGRIFQLRITLVGSEPAIWRRVLVPDEFTLGDFHLVIQAAMGWEDCHLHGFQYGKRLFGPAGPGAFEGEENEDEILLLDLLKRRGARLQYDYDFGDNWTHDVVLEKVLGADPELFVPACTAGEGACPPEDVGGIARYNWLVHALSVPESLDDDGPEDELLDWVGEDFDPGLFDIDEVNRRLRHMMMAQEEDTDSEAEEDDLVEDEVPLIDYDATRGPTSEQWLDLDEVEKVLAVEDYHRAQSAELEPEGLRMHAIIHSVIEEQIAWAEPPAVGITLERLMREGLDRHEAIHAIGSVLLDTILDVASNGREPDEEQYARGVTELTAKAWQASRQPEPSREASKKAKKGRKADGKRKVNGKKKADEKKKAEAKKKADEKKTRKKTDGKKKADVKKKVEAKRKANGKKKVEAKKKADEKKKADTKKKTNGKKKAEAKKKADEKKTRKKTDGKKTNGRGRQKKKTLPN